MLSRFIRQITHFLYKHALKPIFFACDPEAVHNWFLRLGRRLGGFGVSRGLFKVAFCYSNPALRSRVFGLDFSNPVGLSAGFDKNGDLIGLLPSFGFGFSTIGSVTLNPYPGNPKPRLLRLPRSKGIVVNYGLKNIGTKLALERLTANTPAAPVILAVAKTNSTATCDAEAGIVDYTASFSLAASAPNVAIIEINISCPNAFGGEPFTTPEKLERLLAAIRQIPCSKPITIKMPIDLEWPQFKDLLDIIIRHRIEGVTIGNLNKDRTHHGIIEPIPTDMPGGISGRPCFDISNELISKTYQYCGQKLVIIGVGGIFSAQDAYEKIRHGASLVALITGMIFEGPQLIGQINYGLAKLLARDGFKNIGEAVGCIHRQPSG